MECFTSDEYIQHVRAYYDQRLSEYGEDVRSLYWGSTASQQVRFETLFKIGDLNRRSIQDIGCGFGDLYGFLRERGVDVEYRGVDLNPRMVEIAQNRYPEADFQVANILAGDYDRRSDYVVESGILTEEHRPWHSFVEQMLHRMFELAEIAIGFNMQSTWMPDRSKIPDHVDYDPLHWVDFCYRRFSRRVVLMHDYLPHDFTIFVYKEPPVPECQTVP